MTSNNFDTSTSDIEDNNYIIRETNTTFNLHIETIFNIKLLTIITLCYIPIVILDLYYATNDTSCVNQNTNIAFTLTDYLIVDSLYGLALLLYLPVIIFIIDIRNVTERQVFCCISLFRTLILFLLTIIGTYIFWGLMDNTECKKNIYYYNCIAIVIRFIIAILFIGFNITH
jgi:hypothetical protein